MHFHRQASRVALAAAALIVLGGCSSKDESGGGTGPGGAPGRGGASGGSGNAAGGATAGGTSQTGGAGGVPAVGFGGGPVVGIGGLVGAGGARSCAGDITRAKLVPLDMYLMLDSSESMLGSTTLFSDKWTDVGDALVSFLRDPGSAGIGVGLQYFPQRLASIPDICTSDPQCGEGAPCNTKMCLNVALAISAIYPCDDVADCNFDTPDPPACVTLGDCSTDPDYYCVMELAEETCIGGACTPTGFCERTSSCDVSTYGMPEVPIAELPGVEPAIVASLQAKTPLGKTPTAPALGGAIRHARQWADAHPERTVVALLATDGLPTECFADADATSEEAVAEVASIASRGRIDGVRTFVIGVFAPEDLDLGARENLNSVALAGGTEQAFIVDASQDVSQQFRDALNEIRGARLSCEFQIPEAEPGREVDLGKVNVDFTVGTSVTRVPQVTNQAACDTTRGGWYYDVNPSAGDPSRIIVCPTSCQAFQSAENASVQIELGCQTEVIE
jgi:hypothetical protein